MKKYLTAVDEFGILLVDQERNQNMAGSLNHIITKKGKFTMNFIENLGDAHEALEECFEIIRDLTDGRPRKVCSKLGYVKPTKKKMKAIG